LADQRRFGSSGSHLLDSNRELEFMLTRGKPLAHFSEYYPPEPHEEIIPKQAFSPHVADGTFVMRVGVELVRELLGGLTGWH
jgi:hypothetical protein